MRRIRTGSHHLKAIAFAFCTVSANASALLRTFRLRRGRCRFLYLILRKMTPLLFALISARLFSMSGLSGFVFRVTAWHRFSGRHRRTVCIICLLRIWNVYLPHFCAQFTDSCRPPSAKISSYANVFLLRVIQNGAASANVADVIFFYVYKSMEYVIFILSPFLTPKFLLNFSEIITLSLSKSSIFLLFLSLRHT